MKYPLHRDGSLTTTKDFALDGVRSKSSDLMMDFWRALSVSTIASAATWAHFIGSIVGQIGY